MATAADLRPVSEDELRKCNLFRCFCCWRRRCSLGILRIGPRSEYLCLPRDLGCSSAPYGLDFCWGEEEEEDGKKNSSFWRWIRKKKKSVGEQVYVQEDSATTDGRPPWSVLVGCTSADHPSHDLRIHYFRVTASGRVIGRNTDLLELFCGVSPIDDKHTMFPVARAAIVPADRHLYIICAHGPAPGSSSTSGQQAGERVFHPKAFSLNTADKSLSTLPPLPFTGGSWEAITAWGKLWVPLVSVKRGSYGGTSRLVVYKLIGDCLAEGYAVLDSRFILPSFSNSIFFLFKCTSGKAVHVQRDGMTYYFIRGAKLFAYKNPPNWDKPFAAPIVIGNIWPYDEEGYGFMEHLGGRMMCAAWINIVIRGSIDESDCFIPNGVDILHSTCRRIDMLRSNAPGYTCCDTFCFLQKYQVRGAKFHPSDLSEMGRFYCPQGVKFSEMLACCREFLSGKPEPGRGVIPLDFCKIATGSYFYFICKADQDTVRSGDVGIHDPPAWYFVHRGSTLDVIPSSPDCDHYVVDVERKSYRLYKSKRSKLFFSAVFRAGEYVVALGDTLQYVYILRNNFQWRRRNTASRSVDVSRKVKVSGFVDLIDDAFMISDFNTDEFFLFDLKRWEWFSVRPSFCFLSGRCIFAEGFIDTCSDEGLAAFELIHDDTSYRLGVPIMLDFSWKYICGNRRFLSFASICKGEIGDCIAFCVVHGHELAHPSTWSHTLATTTIQVQLVETAPGTKKPVRVDHVDIFLSSIEQKRWILPNYAFTL
ncbi:hypothetical protein GQ55_2G299200 [Panicum hallii var. hallii]|uniref:Uncharacterized protein n=1 Tax=Panicum hallii var. hallii TaxID=1504633 RepID=A0A2T7ETT7_9POAL|nr:hypothetical protein GQ55_2G299200 [Panicum hallii var. hallii]